MLFEEQFELPRFTSTLRAFSSVSKQQEQLDEEHDRNLIKKRIKQMMLTDEHLLTISKNEPVTWTNLLNKLMPNVKDQKYLKLKSLLDKLRNTFAKEFLNEDFNDAIVLNEAACMLLELFYEFKSDKLLNATAQTSRFQNIEKLNKKLREKFG
jgi:hypothetical protein